MLARRSDSGSTNGGDTYTGASPRTNSEASQTRPGTRASGGTPSAKGPGPSPSTVVRPSPGTGAGPSPSTVVRPSPGTGAGPYLSTVVRPGPCTPPRRRMSPMKMATLSLSPGVQSQAVSEAESDNISHSSLFGHKPLRYMIHDIPCLPPTSHFPSPLTSPLSVCIFSVSVFF